MIILRIVLCLLVTVGSVMFFTHINQPIIAAACAVGSILGIVFKIKKGDKS